MFLRRVVLLFHSKMKGHRMSLFFYSGVSGAHGGIGHVCYILIPKQRVFTASSTQELYGGATVCKRV